jgi:hypothetical protein
MSEFNLDTYCGLYCGACSIHMAYKTGEKDPFACYWTESTVTQFLQTRGALYPEGEALEHKCHGCKSDTIFINCKSCPMRSCAISRKVEHCALDCKEFPCAFYQVPDSEEAKKFLSMIPHTKAIPKNVMTIKEFGVSEWLNEQEKAWKCPECQTEFSWYTKICANCGKDLEKIKDFNNL